MRITPEGDALAEALRRAVEVADRILSTLTPEEIEQLNVLTEKDHPTGAFMGVAVSPGSPHPPQLQQVAFGAGCLFR